jgi:probable phosphomutase (TIGR03848 family)
MTTFLLIRHAAHGLLNRAIAGRMAGVHLNAEGQAQAVRLAERHARLPIRAIFCSPVERARETALPLAQRLGLELRITETITEIDFGDWSGRTFPELREIPRWQRFNSYRSGTRIPNGELMLEAQARMVGQMERLREEYPNDHLALISHGDVIKSAVAYYLGAPLDLFQRIEISPASVSVIELQEYGPRVLRVNDTDQPLGD